jgi:hypothetical protein
MIKTTIVNEMSIIVNFLETKIRHSVPTKISKNKTEHIGAMLLRRIADK